MAIGQPDFIPGKTPQSGLPKPPPGDDPSGQPTDTTEQATVAGGDEMLLRVKQWERESRDHSGDWRKDAETWYALESGDQWDTEDAALLKKQQRPSVTFNRIGPITDSVSGMEVGNRQEVQYLPRTQGDVRPNEIFSQAAKWLREECQADTEESDMFHDAVVCGMGWSETRPDYEQDPDGLIVVERIDPLEMQWDPSAKKRNLMDRRYHLRIRTMPLEDAQAMLPGFTPEQLDAAWARISTPELHPHNATEAPFYRHDQSGRNDQGRERKLVTLVYAEWWIREPYHRVIRPDTGDKFDATPEQFAVLKERASAIGVPIRSAALTRKRYMQGFFGAEALEIKEGRCKHGFSINSMTAKRDRNKNTWYGLVKSMKDPQQWANKFFSQILYIINSNAKGGLIMEEGAAANQRRFEEQWSNPAGINVVRKGALGKIQPKPAITYPTGLDKLMEFAITSIRDVTGVNLELLGMADRDQPGILEHQRKQAGMTILATIFDAQRSYRREQGKVMLYEIQEYIVPGRLIRITGDNDVEQYVPLLMDPQTVEYDVIVDEAPASPNQKDKTWAMLVQLAPMLMKAQVPGSVWAALIKFSPLPDKVSQLIADALTKPQGAPPPSPLLPAEIALKEAQTAQARSQAVLNVAKAGDAQPGRIQIAQLVADMMSQHGEQQHEAGMTAMGQQHEAGMAGQDAGAQLIAHIAQMAQQQGQQGHEADQAQAERDHQVQLAQMPTPAAEPGAARMQ